MSGQRKHTICSPDRSPFLHLQPERCCQRRGMVEDERNCRRTGEDEGWLWAGEVKMYGRERELSPFDLNIKVNYKDIVLKLIM